MNISFLVNITSKAWSLKILALLHTGTPGRQAPLLAACGASRSSFTASLNHLAELGLLERNPGHGHPLRPEFKLTPAGEIAASMAHRVIDIIPNDEDFDVIRRSWAVPVLAVTETPKRFSSIKTGLVGITDRALSQSLYLLEDHQWIKREIDVTERSPRPIYQAVNTGKAINQAINLEISM
ncbi:winged helix-turn-helix transcriptional regulator [Curvivirga aplysinae]|uniref:winged helix-turn-helix transcriptional regulator n=1 Tax=Curvivirga aplysinae TaxID=2529852 RepID=UPI0012BB66AE|nr:winged helix-turn-helix transcriptional regulator [Curvivirga aplysinae]MTI08316.1 transcriptional regulator [Curvivirga aplysinae]